MANIEEYTEALPNTLRKGDVVYVKAGGQAPMNRGMINGAVSMDKNTIIGESAPVIRGPGNDRSAATGGATLVSDWLIVRVTAEAEKSFLDKMTSMVEGAVRERAPNEITP